MPLYMSVGVNEKFAQINLARLDLGQPVMLCAPGPSLKPLERQPGIMIAALTKAYPTIRPDIWFGMDEPGCYDRRLWSEGFIKIANSSYPHREVGGRKLIEYPLTFLAQTKTSDDIKDIFAERGNQKKFAWYKHTLGVALDVLVWMGARTIYCDGFDLRHIEGRDYCDGARKVLTPDLRDRNQLLFDQQIKFMQVFHAYAAANGINVFSSTPDSPLNVFMEFVARDEALRRARQSVPDPGHIFHCREINHETGTVIPMVRPFSKTGLKQAIADAKARQARAAEMKARPSQPAGVVGSRRGGLVDVASPVETEAFDAKAAKSPDTAENFSEVWNRLKHPLIEQALMYRKPAPMPVTDRPRVGFFFPASSYLAHAVNCRTLLDGLQKIGNPIEPLIYSLGGHAPVFAKAFPDAHYCGKDTALASHLEIRARARADEISAMVFVSSPIGMAFQSTIGTAPKHIWWSHKYHGLDLPYLDGYIDACHPLRDSIVINGRMWPCVPTALPELFDAGLTHQAAAIRAKFKADVLFGTMCREEKLTPAYAAAVRAILDACPNSGFVYAARAPQPWFEEAVGGGRAVYVGWVTTRLWAQVIDVYLDTFPFQGGHTAFETMAASRPVVWMKIDNDADNPGVSEIIEATWRGIYPDDPIAPSTERYISQGVRFASDPNARRAHGIAARTLIDTHMRDEIRMAQRFVSEVQRIIKPDQPLQRSA